MTVLLEPLPAGRFAGIAPTNTLMLKQVSQA
jgi:hypothetical protein